ncbi:MAG: phosphoribosylglycinamide formyltransferase [Candidatus Pacearchaeota archaeon]|jgi:phosphoribosylglycinamide formyltransferase-1
MDLHLGFLASHRGSNVKSILDLISTKELDAYPEVIISNNADSAVLDIAIERGIPNYCLNKKNCMDVDEAIAYILKKHDVNLVILAGYMKKIGEKTLNVYPNRILNIHPSLLPKYGGEGMYGRNIHQSVINSNDLESGATIHIVNKEYDKGKIIAQYKIPRYILDTPETLEERVLKIEHILYPQTLIDIQKGIISLDL